MIWFALLISIGYVSIKQSNDPSFSWRDDSGSFYSAMQVVCLILFVLYSSYFVIVAYVSFFQGALRDMKKSYKISLLLTFGVICLCIILLLLQGYSSSHSVAVAFVSLLNIYMYVIAYLYSPSIESLEDLQFKQARKEHEHIMNTFYEQELPDITGEHKNDKSDKKSAGVENGKMPQKRHIKKDPAQKAKEKLWESIIKETEDENSSDTSDEDNEI